MCFNVFFMAVSICALSVGTKRHMPWLSRVLQPLHCMLQPLHSLTRFTKGREEEEEEEEEAATRARSVRL